jgi:hypothetical protein
MPKVPAHRKWFVIAEPHIQGKAKPDFFFAKAGAYSDVKIDLSWPFQGHDGISSVSIAAEHRNQGKRIGEIRRKAEGSRCMGPEQGGDHLNEQVSPYPLYLYGRLREYFSRSY